MSDAPLTFEVPGGVLRFAEGDLDAWAGHLEWCLRMLDIDAPACIAVQDFGASPLAYLGSSLLMPTLKEGYAERLEARLICLDASPERVVLTPAVIRQIAPDVLVVRDDVLGLLLDLSRRAGVDLAARRGFSIVASVGVAPAPVPAGLGLRRLLHVEAPLLLAPECAHCGSFHLRAGVYALDDDGRVRNLLLDGAAPAATAPLGRVDDRCPRGPDDVLLRLLGEARS